MILGKQKRLTYISNFNRKFLNKTVKISLNKGKKLKIFYFYHNI